MREVNPAPGSCPTYPPGAMAPFAGRLTLSVGIADEQGSGCTSMPCGEASSSRDVGLLGESRSGKSQIPRRSVRS
jgi:hypothetical protein